MVVVQPLGKVCIRFGKISIPDLIPEVVRLRGTVRKPGSMDYIHGAKHDSVSCYGPWSSSITSSSLLEVKNSVNVIVRGR